MSRQKQKGTAWESKIVAYLQARGWPHAERRTLSGIHDKGDVSGIPGIVIEAKDQARHSFAEWLDEATLERDNARADVAVVWAHRRGKSSPRDGYVLMDGETFTWLLKSAGYAPEVDE